MSKSFKISLILLAVLGLIVGYYSTLPSDKRSMVNSRFEGLIRIIRHPFAECDRQSLDDCLSNDNCYISVTPVGFFDSKASCMENSEAMKIKTKEEHKLCSQSGGEWSERSCKCPENFKFTNNSCLALNEEELGLKQACLETRGSWRDRDAHCICGDFLPFKTFSDEYIKERVDFYYQNGKIVSKQGGGCITSKELCIQQGKQWYSPQYKIIYYPDIARSAARLPREEDCKKMQGQLRYILGFGDREGCYIFEPNQLTEPTCIEKSTPKIPSVANPS